MEAPGTAEELEALACLEGTRLAVNWVPQPTVVESDHCLSLIKTIHAPHQNRASWAGIIKEIKDLS
jgi:hypothetical protein